MKRILTLTLIACLFWASGHGQTFWQTFTPPFPDTVGITDVEISNATTAWFLGTRFDKDSSGYLARTTDGGSTFNVSRLPMSGTAFEACMTSTDASTAFVDGLQTWGKAITLKTTDGGQSWLNANTPWDPVVSWPDYIHAFSPAKICQIGDPRDGEYEVYTTGSGGADWVRVPGAAIPDPLSGEFGFNNSGDFFDSHIWFGTNQGRVFHSADFGNTWSVAQTPLASGVGGLAFSNASNGLACGLYGLEDSITTRIFRTANGGATWSEVFLPIAETHHYYGAPAFVKGTPNIVTGVYTNPQLLGKNQTWLSKNWGDTWTMVSEGEVIGWPAFSSPTVGWAGDWSLAHPTRVFKHIGSPLTGLLSMKDLDAETALSPNPASDVARLDVRAAKAGDFWILLNDQQGRLLQKIEVRGEREFSRALEINGLAPGIYSVTVAGAEGSRSLKLVKI